MATNMYIFGIWVSMSSVVYFFLRIFACLVESFGKLFGHTTQLMLHLYQKSKILRLGLDPGGIVFIGYVQLGLEKGCRISIGENFRVFSGKSVGITTDAQSKIIVQSSGSLKIGNQVGITNTSIVCTDSISIGDYTIIGAGSLIIDSNFHDVNWEARRIRLGVDTAVHRPVVIGEDCFIGARCIICKGVTIGARSVVAAGSVVVSDIPAGEIWGGNPAKFIGKA